jgi:hypothetical protein
MAQTSVEAVTIPNLAARASVPPGFERWMGAGQLFAAGSQLPVFTDITRPAGLAHRIVNGDKLSEYLIDSNAV